MDDLGELIPLAEFALAWLVLPDRRSEIARAIAEHLGEYAEHQALKDICLSFIVAERGEGGEEPVEDEIERARRLT